MILKNTEGGFRSKLISTLYIIYETKVLGGAGSSILVFMAREQACSTLYFENNFYIWLLIELGFGASMDFIQFTIFTNKRQEINMFFFKLNK